MRSKLLVALVSSVISVVAIEIILRALNIPPPQPIASCNNSSPFFYDNSIGYELKPYAIVCDGDNPEQVNNEGFRGKDFSIEKSPQTLRILTIGNSIVQGFTVPFKDSWQQVLERNLNLYLPGQGKYKQAEVINAGIGGYVSWQVKKRLVKRGIKYKPDVVMVLAGTNDMVYSALPNWTPDIDLSKIENAYLKQAPPANTPIQIKDLLLKSRIIQLARNARNNRNHKAYIREVISEHQKDSNIAFNQKALDLYLANLEEMYKTIKSNGATMVLLTYPIIINGTLAQNSELNERMVVFYQGFPLSANEFVKWHQIYTAAEKDFAKRHDDILLIDLAGEWEQKGKEERLKLFVDQVHHTKYGHEVFAKDVFDEITKQYKVIMEK